MNATNQLSSFNNLVSTSPTHDEFKSWAQTTSLPLIEKAFPALSKVTFVYYNNEDTKSIKLQNMKTGKTHNLRRQKKSNIWAVTINNINPEEFEYIFLVEINNRIIKTHDPYNPFVNYSKQITSHIRRANSPQSATILAKLRLSDNPSGKKFEREILISLPEGYFANLEKSYPVLYMHDGQQILDSTKAAYGGWKVDSTAQSLAREGKISPIIIVGIFNSGRRDHEMMGWSTYHIEESKVKDANLYADAYDYFVTKDVKEFVDKNFRTKKEREFTAIAGASSGAMVALYELFTHPDVYSKAAALSGGFPYYDDLRNFYFPNRNDSMIYLDCGTVGLDGELLSATKTMDEFLRKNGYTEGSNYLYQEMQGHQHTEKAWASRVADFLLFFFGI